MASAVVTLRKDTDFGLTPEQLKFVSKAFRNIDANGNGQISLEELEKATRVLGHNLSKEELQEMIALVDLDGNGQIDFKEFAILMRDKFGALTYQDMNVQETFKFLDKDGNGYIDYDELRAVLQQRGKSLSEEEFQRVVKELDADGNGRIEFEELSRKMRQLDGDK